MFLRCKRRNGTRYCDIHDRTSDNRHLRHCKTQNLFIFVYINDSIDTKLQCRAVLGTVWLFRPFAGSPSGLFTPGSFAPWLIRSWLVRPLACSPLGAFVLSSWTFCPRWIPIIRHWGLEILCMVMKINDCVNV